MNCSNCLVFHFKGPFLSVLELLCTFLAVRKLRDRRKHLILKPVSLADAHSPSNLKPVNS